MLQQDLDYSVGGTPIPQRWDLWLAPVTVCGIPICRDDPFRIRSDYLIGSNSRGNWSFGILTKRDTGYLENGGFLLDAAGIREYNLRRGCQLKEIQITQRLKEM